LNEDIFIPVLLMTQNCPRFLVSKDASASAQTGTKQLAPLVPNELKLPTNEQPMW